MLLCNLLKICLSMIKETKQNVSTKSAITFDFKAQLIWRAQDVIRHIVFEPKCLSNPEVYDRLSTFSTFF